MENKIKVLKLLTWYKSLQEEQAKFSVTQAKINLDKLLKEKQELLKQKKENYNILKKKNLISAEELKNYIFKIEKIFEYQENLNNKINAQKEELKNLYKLLEKAYKERKVMENLKDKAIRDLLFENTKKFYREMDDLVVLIQGFKDEKFNKDF
ncbi:hypothetical protein [Thermodesulfobacterium hydrogeniphilum]|uniref:hypothetical protein n=1 Tax=Thermodesulfobacterium hydrogeniphilum TaxID=161156 RepID=UPI000570F89B|nr:hypothetical protein [Thermodesulfobacterium hydrogeniphilum]